MGMRVKRDIKANKRTFIYTGDLAEAVEKAKEELKKKKESQERAFLLWQYERAKKAYLAYEQRIDDLNGFIECVERDTKKDNNE